jgi:lysophospholipase L1-like esterase
VSAHPTTAGGGRGLLRRLALPLLAVALVLSLAANAYFGRLALEYFAVIQEIRLDPGGRAMWASDHPNAGSPASPVLVFYGDSRAVMWPAPPETGGYRIVNRGEGNQTTAQILLRFDADVAPLRPSVVVIEAGVNDLKTISEFPRRRAEIVAQCEANLKTIIDRSRETGATVVLTTVFGIGDVALWRRPLWSSEIGGAVHEVNAFLRGIRRDRVFLFDADPVLGDASRDVKADYQLDHLHLSKAGYVALNQKLGPLLSSLPR